MHTYSYKALKSQDETRLLALEPGGYEDPLVGSIIHINLANAPDYDAISYCWENCKENSLAHLRPDAVIGLKDVSSGTDIQAKVGMGFYSKVRLGDMATHSVHAVRETYFANGGSRPPGVLRCDGQAMSIGGELYSALKRFRCTDEQRYLWADAICIHQTDLHEKAAQISNMGQIFSTAQTVLVWLGESTSNLDESFEALMKIAESFRELCGWPEDTPLMFLVPFVARWGRRHDINWDHVAELLRRMWFKRIWCLQEVVKARRVVIKISFLTIPWEDFAFIVAALRDAGLDEPLQARGEPLGTEAVSVMWNMQNSQTQPPILDLLHRTRQRESTLASDKVFAILGLVSEEDREGIRIDYETSPESVFRNLAINHIVKNNSLEILYHCCKSRSASNLHLPTWVPDWTQPAWHAPLASTNLKPHAALDTKPKYLLIEEGSVDALYIRGRIVDKIESIDNERHIPRKSIAASDTTKVDKWGRRRTNGTSPDRDPTDSMDQQEVEHKDLFPPYNDLFPTFMRMAHLQKWFKKFHRARKLSNEEAEGEESPTIKPDTNNAEQDDDKPSIDTEEYGEIFHASILAQCLSQQPGQIDDLTTITESDISKLRVNSEDDLSEIAALYGAGSMRSDETGETKISAGEWCHDRRHFKSERYVYGWCPEGVEVGDKIAVVDGLDVPLVLREVENGFEVCGDCFLFGVMDGQAMDGEYESRMLRLV